MTSFPCAAHLLSLSLLAFSLIFGTASCASAAQWRARSIYQVLTDRFVHGDGSDNSTSIPCAVEQGLYCGGQWSGIKSKLDYIQGMGFDAVWFSPITAQLPQRTGDGEAYTGYWQQDMYALNSNFGTAEELKDLISEMHSRGMYIMLDLVGERHPNRHQIVSHLHTDLRSQSITLGTPDRAGMSTTASSTRSTTGSTTTTTAQWTILATQPTPRFAGSEIGKSLWQISELRMLMCRPCSATGSSRWWPITLSTVSALTRPSMWSRRSFPASWTRLVSLQWAK